ncbi:MAG TPA: Fe-S cluster assembly protein SufD [Chloroflexota bacterium]|nr:Fe-S cluster assembly protein SufD [Chloroflexota bacterium]
MSTLTEQASSLSREAVLALSAQRGEPNWMRDLRLRCWEIYEATPAPTARDEEWRRTDIRWLAPETLRLASPNGHAPIPAEWQPGADALTTRSALLVERAATTAFRLVAPELTAQGVILTDMDTAIREHGELVRASFMTQAVKPEFSKYAALNGAFWSGGAFLYVPDNVEVALPAQARRWLDEPGQGVFPHTLVVVGRNSKVTFIEEAGSRASDGTVIVPVVELVLRAGANLSYMAIQEYDDGLRQIGIQRAALERDSTLQSLTATLGGAFSKLNIDVELREPGTNAEMLGLYFTNGSEFVDYHTLQDHIAPNAGSNLLFKGVLTDTARVVYSGLIRVHEGAQKTDAYQKNNNLILSPTARADSIPNLEIAANDVRCSHGATAGKVSEDHLFYLMSRGLSRREAERLIVTGFLAPLIERVPLADLRQRLYALIDAKMGAAGTPYEQWIEAAS